MYEKLLNTPRDFVFLDKTESTNGDIKKMIYTASSPVFSVVSAKMQLSGRGRLGRSFFSPDGGLYFSFSLPLTGKENNIPFVTLLAGLAVSEAIEELTGVKTEVKWPNDIYLNGKKLGGILSELVSGKFITAVVGVGINLCVSKDDIPSELQDKMTSFSAEGESVPDKNRLTELITAKTDEYVYKNKELYKTNSDTMERIRSRSFSVGKGVKYILGDCVLEGIVTDITNTGAAEILLPDGTKREIFCGEITQ